MYEGYGPSGVAVLIECLTDNRNRAAAEVRVAMTRNGGNMADPGSVSYLFARKGVVLCPRASLSEDDVLDAVLDAGAEEVNDLGDEFEVVSAATDVVAVRTALQERGHRLRLGRDAVPAEHAGASSTRTARARCSASSRRSRTATTSQNVFANFDVSDEVLEAIDV